MLLDSYNSIIETYERLITLIEKGNYCFHTIGSNVAYKDITYDEFISMLPNIEYIDTENIDYDRVYLNPFTRTVLLVCARRMYNADKLMLIRVPTNLINTVYKLMESGIKIEYQNTIAMFMRKVGELEKKEDEDLIQPSNGRSGNINETDS